MAKFVQEEWAVFNAAVRAKAEGRARDKAQIIMVDGRETIVTTPTTVVAGTTVAPGTAVAAGMGGSPPLIGSPFGNSANHNPPLGHRPVPNLTGQSVGAPLARDPRSTIGGFSSTNEGWTFVMLVLFLGLAMVAFFHIIPVVETPPRSTSLGGSTPSASSLSSVAAGSPSLTAASGSVPSAPVISPVVAPNNTLPGSTPTSLTPPAPVVTSPTNGTEDPARQRPGEGWLPAGTNTRPPAAGTVATNFTQFTTVGVPGGAVVTGWNFARSGDARPTDQYCYYEVTNADGNKSTYYIEARPGSGQRPIPPALAMNIGANGWYTAASQCRWHGGS
jgi:hypothetical protein